MCAFQDDMLYSEWKSTKKAQDGGLSLESRYKCACDTDQFAVYSEVLSQIKSAVKIYDHASFPIAMCDVTARLTNCACAGGRK